MYDNASEYVRDLIRKDKERVGHEGFEALKPDLQRAFATPPEDHVYTSAEDEIAIFSILHERMDQSTILESDLES